MACLAMGGSEKSGSGRSAALFVIWLCGVRPYTPHRSTLQHWSRMTSPGGQQAAVLKGKDAGPLVTSPEDPAVLKHGVLVKQGM